VNPEAIARIRCSTPELQGRLSSVELDELSRYEAEKRRSDWVLGRAAAKQAVRGALSQLGGEVPDWGDFSVLPSGLTGAPQVVLPSQFPDLAVSLTHGHGQAAAWSTQAGKDGGLPGVDLERVRPRRLGTLRFYLHPEERGWVLELPGFDVDPPPQNADPTPRDRAAIVLWALKEAAFKALQPERGTGLLDVAVTLDDPYDAAKGTAQITYLGKAEARAELLGVSEVTAGWTQEGDLVLAWAAALGARLPL
jgi:phosphopantetheinyl transferase (holo-ACP synthase)